MQHSHAVNATFVDEAAKPIHAVLYVHSFSQHDAIAAASGHMKQRLSE
jgi:hypothetical protein